ncbi:MAG: T9SS type A sorting domain-containing protein, partial [Chitinophagales bacterium]
YKMKHIFILFLSMLWMHNLYAQPSQKLSSTGDHLQMLTHLLQQQSNKEAALRTTSGTIANRVIAQSTRDNTLATLSDSVNLRYHYFRTSTYDYNTMIYPYNYPYSTSPMFNYAGVFTKPQVQYDTLIHWTVNPFTLVYGLYESEYANYDSATKNLLNYKHIFIDSVTNKNMSYINTFNTANNIASGYWFNLKLGVADSAYKQFFTYNSSSNKLTKDSTYEYHLGAWHLVSRSLYTYDVSNNLTQIDNYSNTTDTTFTQPLTEQIQYINTYDVSGRLLTVLENYYDSMSLSLSAYVKDTFAYSGTHTYHNSWREYQYDPINHYWAPMFNMTKVTNALGLPDTVNIKGFDSLANSWVPQTMDIIKYDTAKNPDTLRDYEYNFTAFPSTPNYTTVYYYQTYYDTAHTTAINNIIAANDRAVLFPNPANNTITISQLAASKNSTLSIALMNVNGQMVRRESMHWQSEVQISVNDLQPGIYWIVIQDENGKLLHRQAVVKQ